MSLRDLLVPPPPSSGITQVFNHAQLFIWVLGIELGSLSLCSKHFINRAISPTPTSLNSLNVSLDLEGGACLLAVEILLMEGSVSMASLPEMGSKNVLDFKKEGFHSASKSGESVYGFHWRGCNFNSCNEFPQKYFEVPDSLIKVC